jgi:hypothetical protein
VAISIHNQEATETAGDCSGEHSCLQPKQEIFRQTSRSHYKNLMSASLFFLPDLAEGLSLVDSNPSVSKGFWDL